MAPKLPILVGGQTEAALKRAAAYGSGWCGFNLTPSETADAIARLRTLLKENHRDPRDFEYIVAATPQSTPADLPAYRQAGVDQVDLTPVFQRSLATDSEIIAMLEELAHQWVEPAAQL